MNLKLAHIGDLVGMRFNIPYYQRGYRWEDKQVHDLLEDLFEFGQNKSNGQFYCLQPLVVTPNLEITGGGIVYDVIDGQQRLTTLFLLLEYLGLDSFNLRYERAILKDESREQYDNGKLCYNELKQLEDADIKNNPDYFYINRAMLCIGKWFDKKREQYPKIKRIIEDILINPQYEGSRVAFYDNKEDVNIKLPDVRFIWYDASEREGVQSCSKSIEVFKRLNYGKTALTAAELIKALLFQCDVYDVSRKAEMKQVAFRMSTEWDAMEKELQDDFMWSMISPQEYDKPSRIDLVLSFVAKELKEEYVKNVMASESSKDYDYYIFNSYIRDKQKEGWKYQDIVKELWAKIQDTYAIFRNWFADRELYHLTGLYFALMKNTDTKQHLQMLQELVREFKSKDDREKFVKWLKEDKIGELIRLKDNFDEQTALSLENVYYGDFSKEIVRILLVYNVDVTMKHMQDRAYFPFKFYREKEQSIEHIHPQHLHDGDIDFITRSQWFKDKCNELTDEDLADVKLKGAVDELRSVLILSQDEYEDRSKEAKKSCKEKEARYNENIDAYNKLLEVIDRHFDELVEIKETELHGISNLALVDKITNIRLGNGLLNTKRAKLQQLSDEYDRSGGECGACTYMGTWKVFNKEFSSVKASPSSVNLRFWAKIDRENYFKELEKVYNEYVK